jgi:hypothetical protein
MSDELQPPKSLEGRVSFLETELLALKDRLAKLDGSQQESPNLQTVSPSAIPTKAENKPSPISVSMVSKNFHKANLMAGDAGDRIDFTFLFKSLLEKDVRAFKGAVVIKDLFDQDILRVTLMHETGLSAKGTTLWKGGIKYNQFIATHQRLLTVEQIDITVSFVCESIIYADGTRESFT